MISGLSSPIPLVLNLFLPLKLLYVLLNVPHSLTLSIPPYLSLHLPLPIHRLLLASSIQAHLIFSLSLSLSLSPSLMQACYLSPLSLVLSAKISPYLTPYLSSKVLNHHMKVVGIRKSALCIASLL